MASSEARATPRSSKTASAASSRASRVASASTRLFSFMNLGRLLVFAPFLPLVRKVFKQLVEQRHKHQRQRRAKYHAANRHRANCAPAAGPGTGGDHQREHADDEGQDRKSVV